MDPFLEWKRKKNGREWSEDAVGFKNDAHVVLFATVKQTVKENYLKIFLGPVEICKELMKLDTIMSNS